MTGRRLSPEIIERIFVLRTRDQLPPSVISQRLGISVWTVIGHIKQFRKAGRLDGVVLQKLR